jgi:FdhE protein
VGPRTFLDRWFGPPDLAPHLGPALADLERLATDRPELSGAARALGRLIAAAFDASGADAIAEGDWRSMRAAWSEGRPSFLAYVPRFDRKKLVGRLRRLVEAVGPEVESAGTFARAIDSKRVDLLAWVAEILAGRPDEVARRAAGLGIEPEFAASILRLTLLPSLARISAELDRSRPEGAWDRGDCPHCGSRPLLAESRGLEQRIYYRCGLCAADWPGERLRCPSCGEANAKALHHSFVEGEQERCRLAHCETCLYDWKVVSTLTALSPPAMIVADLATVHLDLLAADRRKETSP